MDTLDTVTDTPDMVTVTDTLATRIADMDFMVATIIMAPMAAIITDHSRRNWKISSPTPRRAKALAGILFFSKRRFCFDRWCICGAQMV